MQVSRRTVVLGGAAGVAVVTSGIASGAFADDDPALVIALEAEARLAALARTAQAPQATFLSWTANIHERHAQLLAGLLGRDVPTYDASPVSAGKAAYGQVADAERRLIETLRSSCGDTTDPQVARLLASMAGAASQQAAVVDGLA